MGKRKSNTQVRMMKGIYMSAGAKCVAALAFLVVYIETDNIMWLVIVLILVAAAASLILFARYVRSKFSGT